MHTENILHKNITKFNMTKESNSKNYLPSANYCLSNTLYRVHNHVTEHAISHSIKYDGKCYQCEQVNQTKTIIKSSKKIH